MRHVLPLALAAALALAAHDASAQRYPGRDRGGSPREMHRDDTTSPRAQPSESDPFALLERELPSLKVDLGIKVDQIDAWQVFERDVRELAELGRQRRRQLMQLRDPDAPRPAGAGALIASLADHDRRRADASADLQRHFDQLYARLDDNQRRMVDRRVALSQTEPLGSESTKPAR